MLVGADLVATTLISNLFTVGPAFENLITDFHPALTQQSIDTARADIASLSAVQTILTYFGFMFFLPATLVLIGAALNAVPGTSIISPPITILASIIYEVLFITFFVRKYQRYRQSGRFRRGSS